jgi:hypothetical protein
MRDFFGTVARSALMGALVGLPILGVGGRILMRVIAHWEGRVPAFSVGGTITVLFMGTMAGVAGGAVHGILRRLINSMPARNILFAIVCTAFTWRAVNALLPRPRLMFVALTFAYIIVMELITARYASRAPFSPEAAPSNPIT